MKFNSNDLIHMLQNKSVKNFIAYIQVQRPNVCLCVCVCVVKGSETFSAAWICQCLCVNPLQSHIYHVCITLPIRLLIFAHPQVCRAVICYTAFKLKANKLSLCNLMHNFIHKIATQPSHTLAIKTHDACG